MYLDFQYAATLPPGAARCGNGAFGAMMLIFPVGPFLGVLGAVVGFLSALLCDASTTYDPTPPTDDPDHLAEPKDNLGVAPE